MHGDEEHDLGRQPEQHVAAGHHVDAGRDHRRGVDERGDGGRAGHRVRQPDVQRDLRALAHGADEEAETDERQRRRVPAGVRRGLPEDLREAQRAEGGEDAEHAEQEAVVADPVDDERLRAGGGGVLAVEVVADEQVRAEAHALPAHEHQDEVLGEHEDEHREQEEVQVREEPGVAGVRRLAAHVADGVDVDEEADEGHERQHQRRERIQPEGQIQREVADGDPAPVGFDERALAAREVRNQPRVGRDGGQGRRTDTHHRDEGLAEAGPEQSVDRETREGDEGDQPERSHRARVTTSGGGSC